MHLLLIPIFVLLSLVLSLLPVQADTQFEQYMEDFYEKQEMASKLLKEVENDLKDGSREKVCARQREAAAYGIKATESLIKAFEISGTAYEMKDIKAGLNKWRDIRDNC